MGLAHFQGSRTCPPPCFPQHIAPQQHNMRIRFLLYLTENIKFFPESERTGPPVMLDRPVTTGEACARRAPAGARGDTDVAEGAVDKNALFRRIMQSTRCQQKEQLRLPVRLLAAAVRLNAQHT